MRCVTCGSDKGKDGFTKSQLKKPAGERRCAACTTAAASDEAPARVSVGAIGGDGGGAGPAPAGASGEPPTLPTAIVGSSAPLVAAVDTAPATPADAPAEPLKLVVGARVELVGHGAAQLNGILATATSPLNTREQWVVTTDEGRVLAIFAANLRVVVSGAAAAAAETVGGASEREADASVATAATTATICSWAACGSELSGEAAARNRCGRCTRAYYCSHRCQKGDWKGGGHKLVCKEAPCCTICLEGGDTPLPMQRGCGCRGDAGLAHVACISQSAVHRGEGHWHPAWAVCATCGQRCTRGMQLGLARELVLRMETRSPADINQLAARDNLGQALRDACASMGRRRCCCVTCWRSAAACTDAPAR